jgi:hypothetical protein
MIFDVVMQYAVCSKFLQPLMALIWVQLLQSRSCQGQLTLSVYRLEHMTVALDLGQATGVEISMTKPQPPHYENVLQQQLLMADLE